MWLDILRLKVTDKGPRAVAQELGISHTTISLVLSGKYNASTERVEERVQKIYGNADGILCEVLGQITPNTCSEKWTLAKKIGSRASNPDTIRLYKACLKCSVRRV